MSTCFWALLSQKDLSFVYLSPRLSKSLGEENDLLLGTSFFDYFHPEEQGLARHDFSELIKKKTLSCSVTRCQYNTIQTMRKKLQQSVVSSTKSSSFQQISSQYSPASYSPNFTPIISQTIQQSNDDEYIVMDVVINVVSQDIVLACFHSDDAKQSNSNCVSSTCGETEFTKAEVNKLTNIMRKHVASKVQTPPSTPFPEKFFNNDNKFNNNNNDDNEIPNCIFQILDRKFRNLIFTWPDSTNNISYNKYDFSQLLRNVNITPSSTTSTTTTTTTTATTATTTTTTNNNNNNNNNNTNNNNSNNTITSNTTKKDDVDVETPNCLKLTSNKHILSISGIYRYVESVVIPYGDIIFACFQILPPASASSLGVTSAFKPRSRSAPCSPATTINNNNGIIKIKRPRSPGSLSPLPSSFYHDDVNKRYIQNHYSNNNNNNNNNNNTSCYYNNNNNNNPSHCHQEIPDFIIENRTKRHRVDLSFGDNGNDFIPIKISTPPIPNLLLNPMSPRISPPPPPSSCHDQQQCCSSQQQQQQQQFPFPQILPSKDHQQPPPPQQPYYPHITPPPQQPRELSPKQHDYPSPTNHPSQFQNIISNNSNINNNNNNNTNNINNNINNNNNHHQPQQQLSPSSTSNSQSSSPPNNQPQQRFTTTQFAPSTQQRRNNNGNNNNVQGIKKCESCHTSSSPEWRRGPTGHKTLCNACGLRYSRTIARENRKKEQAQRELEQRQREQREREERARERAATVMMQRSIEPSYPQYRTSNAIVPVMASGQQQQPLHHHYHHHHHHQTSAQYNPSTLPPINYHRQTSHHHVIRPTTPNNQHQHQHQIDLPPPPPLSHDRIGGYTLPPPNHLYDRQQNGAGVPNNNSYQIGNPVIGVVDNHHRRDQQQW